jgi:hypothetical protein
LDLKSNGLPVLTIGLALAIVTLLLSAVSGPIDAAINADPRVSCPIRECFYARAYPPLLAPLSLLIMLLLGGNAFGIRRRQGRTYVSVFEATHAHGTAQLALLKVLVKSVCVLAAIIAIGVSVWISMPLLGDAVFIQMWEVPLSSQLSAVNDAIAALTWPSSRPYGGGRGSLGGGDRRWALWNRFSAREHRGSRCCSGLALRCWRGGTKEWVAARARRYSQHADLRCDGVHDRYLFWAASRSAC